MITVTINEKEYQFVFNANTPELYYQAFNEDLFELTLKSKDDNQILLRRNRLTKLAYIANMQARKTVRELAGRLNITTYLEWAEQFNCGTFLTGTAALEIINAWNDSFGTKAEIKNQESQQ